MIKKLLFTLLLLSSLGALLWMAGPRAAEEPALRPISLPEDLDQYLVDAEAGVDGLRPGTEKIIHWADPATRERTPLARGYVHGFSASRGETYPLADTLAERLGANLFYTRLTGHGLDADAMGEATVSDWLNDVREAYAIGRRLGDQVVLIGTSMGGALATWLATHEEASDLQALVLISPAFGLNDAESQQTLTRLAHFPWGERVVQLVAGRYYGEAPDDPDRRRYWTAPYRSDALVALAALLERVDRADLARVEQPVLIVYAPGDQVVSVDSVEARFPRFGAVYKDTLRVLHSSDQGQHVIAGKYRSPETTDSITEAILDFLQKVP